MVGFGLLIIDLQNDFLQPYGCMGDDFINPDNILKNLNPVIEWCRSVDFPVIWVQGTYPILSDEKIAQINKLPFYLKTHTLKDDPCCRMGTKYHDFHPDIESLIGENDVIIGKEWYSAFKETTLDQFLKSIGINKLLVAGVATNVCVLASVKQANDLGYGCHVLTDCTGARNLQRHTDALDEINKIQSVTLVSSHDFLAQSKSD